MENLYKNAPLKVLKEACLYYAYKKVNYSLGLINLRKKDALEIVEFQKAIFKIGHSDTFLKNINIAKKDLTNK